MSDVQRYTRFEIPSDGRMWVVDGVHCRPDDLYASQQIAEAWRKTIQRQLTKRKAMPGVKIGDPTCHVIELHVQTAETRAEQMRKLAKVIATSGFLNEHHLAAFIFQVSGIFGLDERWVREASGEDGQ